MRRLAVIMLAAVVVGCGVQGEGGRGIEPAATSTEPAAESPSGNPGRDVSTSLPTTAVPPLRDHDFRNRTYLVSCGSELIEMPLVDGEWVHPEGPTRGVIDYFEVEFFDVSGDGEEEAILSIGCGVGAGTIIPQVIVMTNTPTGVTQLGQNIYGFSPTEADGGLTVDNPHLEPNDARCCPSSYIRTLYRLRNGGWSEEGSTEIAVGD